MLRRRVLALRADHRGARTGCRSFQERRQQAYATTLLSSVKCKPSERPRTGILAHHIDSQDSYADTTGCRDLHAMPAKCQHSTPSFHLPPPSHGGGGPQGRRGKAAVEAPANFRSEISESACGAFPLRPLRGHLPRMTVEEIETLHSGRLDPCIERTSAFGFVERLEFFHRGAHRGHGRRRAGIDTDMEEQLLELLAREPVVQAHTNVRFQLFDASKGGQHGNRDNAARRPLQARPRPDGSEAMLEQELPQIAGHLMLRSLVQCGLRRRGAAHLEPHVTPGFEAIVLVVRKFRQGTSTFTWSE